MTRRKHETYSILNPVFPSKVQSMKTGLRSTKVDSSVSEPEKPSGTQL